MPDPEPSEAAAEARPPDVERFSEADGCDCEVNLTENRTHWKGCHQRPVEMTKGQFVDACEGGAAGAIDDYVFMLTEGFSADEARETAVDQAIEGARCFIGIGSCCGGGCKHG